LDEQRTRIDEVGARRPVVAEQRDGALDVGHYRRAPERCRASARDLRDHCDDVVVVFVRPETQPVLGALGKCVRVADVRTGIPEQLTFRLPRTEIAGTVGAPVRRGRQCDTGRKVLLLARSRVRISGNVRISRHAVRLVPDASLSTAQRAYTTHQPELSRAKWMESSSACHDASMMFSFTPIVVHVLSPSVESISTRVTAPVPLFVSSTRTL